MQNETCESNIDNGDVQNDLYESEIDNVDMHDETCESKIDMWMCKMIYMNHR